MGSVLEYIESVPRKVYNLSSDPLDPLDLPDPPTYHTGDRITAQWPSTGKYYAGTVIHATIKGRRRYMHVKFDDGDDLVIDTDVVRTRVVGAPPRSRVGEKYQASVSRSTDESLSVERPDELVPIEVSMREVEAMQQVGTKRRLRHELRRISVVM